jgi:ribosomal protein S18 acetylase RimI-like enzyme
LTGGRIRRAGPRDLEVVTGLWLTLGEHHAVLDPAFGVRRDERGEAEAREIVRRLLRDPDAALLLREQGAGRALGLAIVRIARAPGVALEDERAEISDLWVDPAERRRGIGRALVDASLAWLRERGVGRVSVRVAVANAEGQAFWRALGFADLLDVLQLRL